MKITKHYMQCAIDRLNRTTGNSVQSGVKIDKNFLYNVGHYMVEEVYSGYNLVQIANPGGGQNVLTSGTKRDIVSFVHAYLRGWSDAKQQEIP